MIERKKEQGTGNLIEGIVKQKLTQGYSHPHGIMVDLESGERGRVKKNLSSLIASDDDKNKLGEMKKKLEQRPAKKCRHCHKRHV